MTARALNDSPRREQGRREKPLPGGEGVAVSRGGPAHPPGAVEQLPGYAPELNPDEGVWRYLKRVELKNLVCADLEQLGWEFRAAPGRLLRKPEVLRSCIREAVYF